MRRTLVFLVLLLLLPLHSWGQGQLINGNRTQAGANNYALTTGTGAAYVLTLNPALPGYVDGTCFLVRVHTANTGDATLNVSGRGAIPLRKWSGGTSVPLAAGDLSAFQDVMACYDAAIGPRMQVLSPSGGIGVTDGDKGDLTVSGSGTVWTIDNTAVTYAKLQNTTAPSVLLGRGSASAGVPQEITLGANCTMTGTVLNCTGGTGGVADGDKGDITVASSATVWTIDNTAVTYAKLQNTSVPSVLLGRGAGSAGSPQEITLGANLSMSGTTLNAAGTSGVTDGDKGDITVSSSGTVWTVDANAITYSKLQDVSAAARLLGRGSTGAGDPEEITLGANCTITGTVLNCTGGASDPNAVTAPAIFAIGNLVQAAGNNRTLQDSGIVATNVATKTGTQTLDQTRVKPRPLTMVDGATLAINFDTYDTVDVTGLTQPLTIQIPTGSGTPSQGQKLDITLYSAAAQPLTWTAGTNGWSEEAGQTLPTTTIAGQYLTIYFRWNVNSAKWAVQRATQFRAKACPLSDLATIPINGNCPSGKFTLTSLSQASTFANPTGTFVDMQYFEIRVISTLPQDINWDTHFSENGQIAKPVRTTGGGFEDHFGWVRNGPAGTWVLVATNQSTLASRTGKCPLRFDVGGFQLTDADLTNSLYHCSVPETATIDEIELRAVGPNAPSVTFHRNVGGSIVALTTSPLATGAAGALSCAKVTATVGRGGVTCVATLQNTALAGGNVTLGSTSGVANLATLVVGTIYYIRQ